LSHRTPVAAVVMTLGAALLVAPISPAARPARAAEAAKVAVAVVNIQRVMNEAKPVASLDAEFKSTLDDQQKQLNNMYAGRLLDDKERAELETLQKLPSPNPTQTKRIAELAKLSDADRNRRTQLANYLEKQNQRVMQLQQSLGQARQQKQENVMERAMNTIMTAVRAVATERGIEMVVDRSTVLFSRDDRDITDEVLRRLNGEAPAKK
jgi:Skp family chaperone for outer membrane proteins